MIFPHVSHATVNINRLSSSKFFPWLWPTKCAHRKSATIQTKVHDREKRRVKRLWRARKSRRRVFRMIRNRTEDGSRASWERKVKRNGERRKGSRRCCTLVRVQFRVKTLSRLQIYIAEVGKLQGNTDGFLSFIEISSWKYRCCIYFCQFRAY